MTLQGWAQIALYALSHCDHHEAAGRLHDPRVQRRAHAAIARAATRRAAALPGERHRRNARAELGYLRDRHALFQHRGLRDALSRCSACRLTCRSIRKGQAAVDAGPRLQHLGQLRHQHELAILRAGNHDELPRADGGAHRAQLPFRRHRHRARGGAHPRFLAPPIQHGRQFLGRYDPVHALRAAAGLHRGWPVLRLAGHAAEPARLYRSHDA